MAQSHTVINTLTHELETASAVAARYGNRPDCLIEILHDVQHELGHVPEAVVPAIAAALNLSRAEVHGVVTFYHDFRRAPQGRHTISICRAESCQAAGGYELSEHAQKSLKVKFGETTSDGSISLHAVYCLGLCATSPAIMVDDKPKGRVDNRSFNAVVRALRADGKA